MISARGFFAWSNCADDRAVLDLAVDGVAVEQVQRLRQVRLHLHLARADRLARGPAEGRQEVVGGLAVGDLHGPRTQRQAAELLLASRSPG